MRELGLKGRMEEKRGGVLAAFIRQNAGSCTGARSRASDQNMCDLAAKAQVKEKETHEGRVLCRLARPFLKLLGEVARLPETEDANGRLSKGSGEE